MSPSFVMKMLGIQIAMDHSARMRVRDGTPDVANDGECMRTLEAHLIACSVQPRER